MPIRSVELKNFTVFENLKCEFSPGVNIFIGENGTGKTHLLKALYSFCECSNVNFHSFLKPSFQGNLRELFRKSNGQIATDLNVNVSVNETVFQHKMFLENDGLKYDNNSDAARGYLNIFPVFIPAKDMLTHGGLEYDYDDRELPIDATLIEILK